MTSPNPPRPGLDQTVSAFIDDEAETIEVERVRDDLRFAERVDTFRKIAGLVGTTPAVPPGLADKQISAALGDELATDHPLGDQRDDHPVRSPRLEIPTVHSQKLAVPSTEPAANGTTNVAAANESGGPTGAPTDDVIDLDETRSGLRMRYWAMAAAAGITLVLGASALTSIQRDTNRSSEVAEDTQDEAAEHASEEIVGSTDDSEAELADVPQSTAMLERSSTQLNSEAVVADLVEDASAGIRPSSASDFVAEDAQIMNDGDAAISQEPEHQELIPEDKSHASVGSFDTTTQDTTTPASAPQAEMLGEPLDVGVFASDLAAVKALTSQILSSDGRYEIGSPDLGCQPKVAELDSPATVNLVAIASVDGTPVEIHLSASTTAAGIEAPNWVVVAARTCEIRGRYEAPSAFATDGPRR